jgi:hypothetical protein
MVGLAACPVFNSHVDLMATILDYTGLETLI